MPYKDEASKTAYQRDYMRRRRGFGQSKEKTHKAVSRFKVFTKDGFTCRYCGKSPLKDRSVVLHCDHIIPKVRGGEDNIENLVTSCSECNQSKRDVLFEKSLIEDIMQREG